MKTKFLAIFAIAAILMACDNKQNPELKTKEWHPGQEVTITIGGHENSANVCSRKITGFVAFDSGTGVADPIAMAWYWEMTKFYKDQIKVIATDGTSSMFTINAYETLEGGGKKPDGWATFTGVMPSGFDANNPAKSTFTVECGCNQEYGVPQQQEFTVNDELRHDMMYFSTINHDKSEEVVYYQLGDQVQLYAQWAVLRLHFNIQAAYTGDLSDMSPTSQTVIAKIAVYDGTIETDEEPICYIEPGEKSTWAAMQPCFAMPVRQYADGFTVRIELDSEKCTGQTTQYEIKDLEPTELIYEIRCTQDLTFAPNKLYWLPSKNIVITWKEKN